MLMVHAAPSLQLARTYAAFAMPLFNLFGVSRRKAVVMRMPTLGKQGRAGGLLAWMRCLIVSQCSPMCAPTASQGYLKPLPAIPAAWIWMFWATPFSYILCEAGWAAVCNC